MIETHGELSVSDTRSGYSIAKGRVYSLGLETIGGTTKALTLEIDTGYHVCLYLSLPERERLAALLGRKGC